MKRPLLKPQQHRLPRITPRPLGENHHTLALFLHHPPRPLKRLHRLTPIHAINKHRATQRHKPSQKRYLLQTLLRRHRAMSRPYRAQEQNIQLRLMIRHDDIRPLAIQYLLTIAQDFEAHADGVGAHPFEGFGGRPLAVFVVQAEAAEEGAGDCPVDGAEDQGGVGGEAAGEEAEDWGCVGKVGVQGEEGEGEGEVGEEGVEGVEEQPVHCRREGVGGPLAVGCFVCVVGVGIEVRVRVRVEAGVDDVDEGRIGAWEVNSR